MMDLFTSAKQARDEALQQVAQGSLSWMDKAIEAVQMYPEKEATGEELRIYLEQKIGQPHHYNVFGALIMACARKGIIRKTGEYRACQRKESHARVNPVYQVTPQIP